MLPEETPPQPEVAPPIGESPTDVRPYAASTPPARDAFWGYTDLALVLGLVVAALVVIVLGAAGATFIWPGLRTNQAPLILPTQLALYFALLLILKLDITARYGRPMLRSLAWRSVGSRTLVYAALAGLALPFVISAIGVLLRTPKVTTQMDELMKTLPLIPLGIVAVVLAPFFEELFFRGFLQPLFTRSFGIIVGVVVTGVLFGGLHAAEYSFVWQYVVAISVVGVALGAMRVWSGSIVSTTLMHACFNGLQVIAFAFTKHT